MASRTVPTPVKVLGITTTVMAVLAASGCGGSDGSGGKGNTSPGSVAGSLAKAKAGGGSAKAPDVCALMPAATLASISGAKFDKATEQAPVGGGSIAIGSCEYTGGLSAEMTIDVTSSGGQIGYQSILDTLHTMKSDPDPVSGVGDKAFSQKDPSGNAGALGVSSFASYGALFGDVFIKISGLTYVNTDQGKQIVEKIHDGM